MKISHALGLLALGSVLLVPATSAQGAPGAESRPPSGATTTDARTDVRFEPSPTPDGKPGKSPRRTQGDISKVRVEHGTSTVSVLIRYVDLNRSGINHRHVVQLMTPSRRFQAEVVANPNAWRGKARLVGANGVRQGCLLSWRLDYDVNSATIVIPRSCLGNPRWIRAGAGMANTVGETSYFDDGLTAGDPGVSLVLGPRLFPFGTR